MTERPILFGSDMVKAILKDRKNQTRRPIKPQPVLHNGCTGQIFEWRGKEIKTRNMIDYCPFGKPGDLLWVRETFCVAPGGVTGKPSLYYKADGPAKVNGYESGYLSKIWKPSIHMPRGYSRLLLEIEWVGFQRIQEISAQDCIAEGMERLRSFAVFGASGEEVDHLYRIGFESIWKKIYPEGPYS
jgi:hypothetical protein